MQRAHSIPAEIIVRPPPFRAHNLNVESIHEYRKSQEHAMFCKVSSWAHMLTHTVRHKLTLHTFERELAFGGEKSISPELLWWVTASGGVHRVPVSAMMLDVAGHYDCLIFLQ